MELPLGELPADLFHNVLMAWRAWNGPGNSDALVRAETRLRNAFDESAGRLALFARLVAGLAGDATRPLAVEIAGVGLFLTALSARSGQSRDMAALSTNVRHTARFALGLRAGGASSEQIDDCLLRFHPDRLPPRGLGDVTGAEARQMLMHAAGGAN